MRRTVTIEVVVPPGTAVVLEGGMNGDVVGALSKNKNPVRRSFISFGMLGETTAISYTSNQGTKKGC